MEGFGAPALSAPAALPAGFNSIAALARLRMASAGFTTSPDDDPADTLYTPRLYGDIEVNQSALDAAGIGGRVALGIAEVEVFNADRALDAAISRGVADGRAAWVRVVPVTDTQAGNFGAALGDATLAFRGIVQRVEGSAHQRARIAITDASERLATPLQNERFAGTGGLEGPATLTGRPKPIALGFRFNITPVPLGNIDLGDGALPTYAVHWRAVQEITTVRIRGVEQVAVGAAPGVGEFREWPDDGAFQLGSTPDGAVTCDVEGDNVGGYVASTSGVIRRLVQTVGPRLADNELQVASFDFAETDIPGAVGLWRGADETTAAAAIDELLAGCGAILCGARDGTLRLVDPLAEGEAQFALDTGTILDLEPLPMPAALRPLPREVTVDWAPNATVLTDLAGVVTDDDRVALTGAASGPARAASAGIETRVAQHREMRLPGRYSDEADATTRAERWREFFEASPRIFRLTTDRYLGQIETGDLGAIAYPAYGLENGVGVVALGWSEQLAGRRLTLTVATVPWVTTPAVAEAGVFFVLDEDLLA